MAPSFAFLLFGICLSVRFGLAGLVQRQSGDSITALGSDPTQAVDTGSAPSSFPTSPPSSQGTVITIDSSWLSDDGTASTSVLSEGDLTVLLPPADNSNSEDFSDLNAYTLSQSLPYLLQELGVDSNDIPSLVSEAIPLFLEAILDALTGDDSESSAAVSRVMKRSISSDLGSWISEVISKATNLVQTTATDVGCGIFAAAAVPVFDAGAALFAAYNAANTGVPTSQDQDFYILPLYGSISHDDSIVVYYNANFIPGFADALGVTMGRNIYIRNTASSASATDPGFQATMALLLHEFTHITQYKGLDYNLDVFGARYMWEYCQGGFDYFKIPMEIQAENNAVLLNGLLTDPIGKQFVTIYDNRGVDLGLPTAVTYTTLPASTPQGYSLAFQLGTMTIQCTGSVCS